MLDPATSLKSDLLALSPTMIPIVGITNFVGVIANYMNTVQGGSMGTPGIFTLNNPAMIAGLSALVPVNDNSWIVPFTLAFQAACLAAVITPATVTNPVWIGSGSLDVATLPIGAATITTIPVAVVDLTAKLMSAQPDSTAPLTMSEGVHDATLDFIFTCIGLAAPPALTPIPIPTQAQ